MIRRHVVLYDSASEGDGTWVRLDSRYEREPTRPFQISMNAADTIIIQGTTVEAKDVATLLTLIDTDDITALETYTGESDVNDVINGSWTFIRAVKSGTAGAAKVQGFV